MTIQAPPGGSFKYPLFSTETYSENKTGDPTRLQIYVPRFVEGPGSLIRINAGIDNRSNTSSGNYIVYVTYDQGSDREKIPIVPKPPSFEDQFRAFWLVWGGFISLTSAGVFVLVSALIVYKLLLPRKRGTAGKNMTNVDS